MILVDTSVWVAMLRRRRPLDLEALVDFEDLATCLPVIQEVLQGIRDEDAFRRAEDAMLALPCVEAPVRWEVVREAIDLYRTARAKGLTVRSSTDCLIAACALRHRMEVLHVDRDFDALAKVSRLRHRRVG